MKSDVIDRLRQLLSEFQGSLPSAQETLQQWYRDQHQRAQGFRTDADRYAYLAARFPTTYSVVEDVLKKLPPLLQPQSLLDLGSGPGTATLAAIERWPQLSATLIEQDKTLLRWSQQLLASAQIMFRNDNLKTALLPATDIVILSYVLNELDQPLQILEKAWQTTQQALILIFPGTPRDFEILLQCRSFLIQNGAWIAAPCPHHTTCPLATPGDWCHFSVRVQRSDFQKRAKQGTLGWEDEKYAYLIAARQSWECSSGRLVKRPLKASGHITLDICTADGLQRHTLTKSAPTYRAARKASWGEAWKRI